MNPIRIRPARLAALLLGKRSSPPFVGLGLEQALRLLRLAGAPIETQITAIAEAQGSSLWLEDFLEALETEESSRKIINVIITLLVDGEGQYFWHSVSEGIHSITRDDIIAHLESNVFESNQKYANFKAVLRKEGQTVDNSVKITSGNNSQIACGDGNTQTQHNQLAEQLNPNFYKIRESLKSLKEAGYDVDGLLNSQEDHKAFVQRAHSFLLSTTLLGDALEASKTLYSIILPGMKLLSLDSIPGF